MFPAWLPCRRFREDKSGDKRAKDLTSTPALQRGHTVGALDVNAPIPELMALSSTPYYEHKNKIQREIFDLNAFKIETSENQVNLQIPNAPDVLCENTGIVMSPICPPKPVQHTLAECYTDDEVENRNSRTFSKVSDVGISNCYNTKDILDGLDSGTNFSTNYLTERDLVGTKTVVSNYSVDEEAGISDSHDDTENNVTKRENMNRIVATDLQNKNRRNESDTQTKTTPINTGKSSIAVSPDTNTFCSPFTLKLGKRSLTNISTTCETENELPKKCYSLQYRTRDSTKMSQSSKGELVLNAEAIHAASVWNKRESKNLASSGSYYTDVGSTMCDVDEYTLTTSEDEREVNEITENTRDNFAAYHPENTDSDLEWDFSADKHVDLHYSDSFTKGLPRKRRLRSDSFLEAVAGSLVVNDQDKEADETTTPTLSRRENRALEDSDTEQSYYNYGYEFDGIELTEDKTKANVEETSNKTEKLVEHSLENKRTSSIDVVMSI